MSQDQASSSQHAPSTWTEPPWSGWIETTGDALLILEAARRGLIPRVTRRLVDSERKMITSGSVFVFDEDESGIKRWTDGFFWSPSRILGNFLLYRETEKRGAGHRSARADREVEYVQDPVKQEAGQSLSRPKSEASRLGIDRQRERSLVGSLTNSYKFKPGGMMKKTFSLTIGGVAQHLISYYKVEDVEQGRLRAPSSLPELAALDISPEYLDKTHFRNPPKVEIGVDGVPRYRGEADEPDPSPILSPPLLLPSPDDEPSSSKRGKRYEPYGGSSAAPKRPRKKNNGISSRSQESAGEESSSSPTYPTPIHSAPYAEHGSLSATTNPNYAPQGYNYYPSYSSYSSGYAQPAASSSYTPAPVSPLPAPQTPTPPPQTSPTPIPYPSYTEPHAAPVPTAYSTYYTPQHGYGSYSQVGWPTYSTYPQSTSSVHHQHASGSHDGLQKEEREEVDSTA